MSTPDIPRYAPVSTLSSAFDGAAELAEPERVSFGGAQTLEADTARAVMALWYCRARANVGTALTAAEVGPLVLELLTPQIMSLILIDWRQRNPALFGAYLAEVLTGVRPSASRKRGQP